MKVYYLIPKQSMKHSVDSSTDQLADKPPLDEASPSPNTTTNHIPQPKATVGGSGKRVRSTTRGNLTRKKKNKTRRLAVPVRVQTYERTFTFKNPPLINFVHKISGSTSTRDAMLSLLQYFENKPSIQWSANGDLIAPFSGFNIVNIMKDLTAKSVTNVEEKSPYYKMLLAFTDIPKDIIRNNKLRESIFGDLKGGSNKKILSNWVCYD